MHAARYAVHLQSWKSQHVHKEILACHLLYRSFTAEPSRKRRAYECCNECEQGAYAQGYYESLFHDISGRFIRTGTHCLSYLHSKSCSHRNAQPAKQPCRGRYKSDGSRCICAETSHHGRIDVLHDNGRDLGKDRRDTEPDRKSYLLGCGHGFPRYHVLQQVFTATHLYLLLYRTFFRCLS